jgi:O-antigen/teichoic acid export membrane protein
VAALTAGGEGARRDLVEAKSLRHLALIVVVTGALLAAALVLLVVPIYGEEFRGSVDLGLILLPGMALLGLTGALGAAIVGRGRPGLSLLVAAITTPVTIVLYLVLIPALDATGAALASTLSYVATFALSAWLYRGLSGRPVLRLLVPSRDELRDLRALAARVRP